MSRLYGRLQSDRRKTDATVGANRSMSCKLTWGSASNPKTAMDVSLVWDKEKPWPSLVIDLPDDIDILVYSEQGLQYKTKP